MIRKIFLLLFILHQSTGDVMDCRYNKEYPTMKNFDVDKMMGRWYIIKKGPVPDDLPEDFENTQNCYTVDYYKNPDNDNDYMIYTDTKYVNSTLDINTKTKAITSINRDNPGWWNSYFKVIPPVGAPVSVVNHVKWVFTDYESWSLHVVCGPYLDDFIYMWQVMTRDKTPEPLVIKAIDAALESISAIKPTQMSILKHDNCPY